MMALVVKVMTDIGVMRTLDTGGDGGVIGNADNNSGPAAVAQWYGAAVCLGGLGFETKS